MLFNPKYLAMAVASSLPKRIRSSSLAQLVRGIKTREGERGEYYAIIRETVALGIPAAIIEHCHVDEDRDKGFCASEEELTLWAKAARS
mgnify:CR=1 FL=1